MILLCTYYFCWHITAILELNIFEDLWYVSCHTCTLKSLSDIFFGTPFIYKRMRMLQSKESTGFIGIFRLCTDNLCQPYKKSQKIKVKSRTKLRNKTSRTMMIEIIRWWTAPRCRWGSQPRRNWTATWAKWRSRKPVWLAMWLPKDWTDFRYFVVL